MEVCKVEKEDSEIKFPTIVLNDTSTSDTTLSYEPTVSLPSKNEIDFRISFDESDNEDYMVIFSKNSFSYKIISVNDLKTYSDDDNKSRFDNLDYYNDFKNEFPAIVYNERLTSKSDPVIKPSESSQTNDEKDTALSKYDKKGMKMPLRLFKNLYEPFGIPFDPKRYYKDGAHTNIMVAKRQFILALGLHTKQEMAHARFGAYWYKSERDPVRRLCHRMISCTIFGRGQGPKKPSTCSKHVKGRKSRARLSMGDFIGRLADHFAPRPERQPDAAADALKATKDVLDAAEGAQDVLPPEEMREIRGELDGNQEVMDTMAIYLYKFTTWVADSISHLLDAARASYTWYSETLISYQGRRVKQWTGEANTSAAPDADDQPNP
nr:hypothetical protein [Tanacetum cinerariifolium]